MQLLALSRKARYDNKSFPFQKRPVPQGVAGIGHQNKCLSIKDKGPKGYVCKQHRARSLESTPETDVFECCPELISNRKHGIPGR